jgi:hypothetical protein
VSVQSDDREPESGPAEEPTKARKRRVRQREEDYLGVVVPDSVDDVPYDNDPRPAFEAQPPVAAAPTSQTQQQTSGASD